MLLGDEFGAEGGTYYTILSAIADAFLAATGAFRCYDLSFGGLSLVAM